jgi:predicted DNA-binding transcriptional regulator AlpA
MRDDRNRFLSDQVAISRLGISRRTFYRYLKEGVIEPPPGKVGKNRRGWTDGDIQLAADQMRNKETVP